MKKMILFFLLLNPDFLIAGGFCTHNKGKGDHADFCSRVNEENCQLHANICMWIEVDEPKKVIPLPKKYCLPKRGSESQEIFCSEYNKISCEVHPRLCEWR